MKSFLISDNRDTWVGMRLAGIEGVILHDKQKVLEKLKELMKSEEIGIVILTEKIVEMAPEEIIDYKLKAKRPLIVEIPDRHGTRHGESAITNYIRESVGIRI